MSYDELPEDYTDIIEKLEMRMDSSMQFMYKKTMTKNSLPPSKGSTRVFEATKNPTQTIRGQNLVHPNQRRRVFLKNGGGIRPIPNKALYHRGLSWTLLHSGCLEALGEMRAQSVDFIFADPPYGLSNDGMSFHAGKRVSVNKGDWDRTRGAKGDYEFHQAWITACRRVLKDNGTLWVSGSMHSIFLCGTALQFGGWHILNDIAWYKPNAAPHLARRMFAHSHETLIWARKTANARYYFDYERMKKTPCPQDFIKKPDRQMRSVWAINSPAQHEKRHGKHPTQKPEMLLQRIVLACTKRGQVVLDPFCGSATTGVAAIRAGRKFIGIDKEKNYLDNYAIPRLRNEEKILYAKDRFGINHQRVFIEDYTIPHLSEEDENQLVLPFSANKK